MAGIYIHIPFCKQACHYCDFHFSTSQKNKSDVINAMLHEIELQKNYFNDDDKIETIYFGGGTPSLLTIEDFEKIILALKNNFNINNLIEFTIEANPDDINIQKIIELKQIGVNRLSIGIQSFDDDDLIAMNRSHNASNALNCVTIANDAGINNISIDLMYGLPNQTNEKWLKNLAIATELNIQHISCYCLTVEERTALHKLISTKKIIEPDENISANHFTTLMSWAAANNFEHYEISNFAKNGYRAMHNTNYWCNKTYLGIGPSAHSYNKNIRKFNVKNNVQYIKKISENEIYFETETLTKKQLLNEYILTNLRTIWGIDLKYITNNFGNNIGIEIQKEIQKFVTKKWLLVNQGVYTLSNEGKFFADHIASELFQ